MFEKFAIFCEKYFISDIVKNYINSPNEEKLAMLLVWLIPVKYFLMGMSFASLIFIASIACIEYELDHWAFWLLVFLLVLGLYLFKKLSNSTQAYYEIESELED